MRRFLSLIVVGVVVGSFVVAAPAGAEDLRSENIARLAQTGILLQADDPKTEDANEEVRGQGTDLAFQGKTMIAGSFQGFGVYKLIQKAPFIRQVGTALCPGGQGDVSIYQDLVFISVDTPQVNVDGTASDGNCNSKDAGRDHYQQGLTWEGVRVFSIKDPTNPQLVGTLEAQCGSHTHTLLPDGNNLYLYMHSYPLVSGIGIYGATAGNTSGCNYAHHRKNFIFEIDKANPDKSKIVGSLDVTPSPGCHDVTFLPAKDLAAAACLTETQIWSIKDPAKPEILSRVRNPFILSHSSGFTWDAKYLLIGDEHAGAVSGTGCAPGDSESRVGAMWFYDITDPTSPQEVGHFGPPRTAFPDNHTEFARHSCTNHNFTVLPMKDPKKYIVSTSWYAAGISVLDFSDPANPEEIAYYVPDYGGEKPDTWAAYWYNGRIYTNDVNLPRASASLPGTPSPGVGVYEVKGLSTKEVNTFSVRLNPQVQIAEFK